jgi:protein O-mannosyl-transferase
MRQIRRSIKFFWNTKFFFCFLVGALSVILYLPSLNFSFVSWDDDLAIYLNPLIRSIDTQNVIRILFDVKQIIRYMPFSHLSWAVLFNFFELNPFAYHLANVVMHSLSAVVLFFIFRILLGYLGKVDATKTKMTDIFALFGASLWAFHPLRVDVVSRASNFTYCASTAMLLISVYLYLKAKKTAHLGSPAYRSKYYWWSVFTFAVSFLFFPVAIMAVGILVLMDFYPLKSMSLRPQEWSKANYAFLLFEKIPFVILTVVFACLNLYAQSVAQGIWKPMVSGGEVDFILRLARGAYIGFYFLWAQAVPGELVPVNPILQGLPLASPILIWASLGVAAISIFVTLKIKKYPELFVAWGMHWLLVAPILGLGEYKNFPIPCDRFSQIVSMIWAFMAAAICLKAYIRIKTQQQTLLLTAMVAITITFASMTLPQQMIWRDSVSLFEYTLVKLADHPYRFDIEWRLGKAYLDSGRPDKAIAHLETARAAYPANQMITALTAYAEELLGNSARATALYRTALELESEEMVYGQFANDRLNFLLLQTKKTRN